VGNSGEYPEPLIYKNVFYAWGCVFRTKKGFDQTNLLSGQPSSQILKQNKTKHKTKGDFPQND